MKQVTIEIPETALQILQSSVDLFIEELRQAAAKQFYEQHRLPLDVAAQLAGLAPEEFSKVHAVGMNIDVNDASSTTQEVTGNGSISRGKAESYINLTPSSLIPNAMPETFVPLDIRELARQQGVEPVQSLEDIRDDFWPEDESVDDFIRTVREWRDESLAMERSIPTDG